MANEKALMKVTKCVTIYTFEDESRPSSQEKWEKWMNCFSMTAATRQALCKPSDWEQASTSHVLLDIDSPNQQLYHLPMLITPVRCIYIVAFDLRNEKDSLSKIHSVMKNVYTLTLYRRETGVTPNPTPWPIVLLVGMHADTAKDRSHFAQRLKERLLKMPYDKLISKPGKEEPFWAVNGGHLSPSGSDALSQEFHRSCSRLEFDVRRWIRYHHKLQEELKDAPCILYRDLKFKLATISSDVASLKFDEFLKFLHDYGFIFYHSVKEGEEVDKVVLVQPQYLCRLFDQVMELKKTRPLPTIADLLSSTDAYIDPSANHELWFQRICIDLGLVVQLHSGKNSQFVFVMGLEDCTPNSPPLAEYSVPPLLLTFKESDHLSMKAEYLLPSFFFTVFVTEFLKALTQAMKPPQVPEMEQHYVQIKIGTARIHLVEQDFCIEVGLQQLEVNRTRSVSTQKMTNDLNELCLKIQRVVDSAAKIILGRLKLDESSIRYGFYHSCEPEDPTPLSFGAVAHDNEQGFYLDCRRCAQPTTAVQEIWFDDSVEKGLSVQICPLPKSRIRKLCEVSNDSPRAEPGAKPEPDTKPEPEADSMPELDSKTEPTYVSSAKDVLHQFQDQFIQGADAKAILFDLKNKNIISDGVETAVRQNTDLTQQNQLLYQHLERVCTEEALMTVCSIMISVPGNPKMRKLGDEMKSMLQGPSEGAT